MSSRYNQNKGDPPKEVSINGVTYRANTHVVTYNDQYDAYKSNHKKRRALVDRGSNGGVAGQDVRVINTIPGKLVSVRGIDQHQMDDIPIVTAGGVIEISNGQVIVILNQYAYSGKGKTIHSAIQLEMANNHVDDKSGKAGGKQRIKTVSGHLIPLHIHSGLPYMDLRPYTDSEWETLPHIVLTSDQDWNPSIADNKINITEQWYDCAEFANELDPGESKLFDAHGNYRNRTLVHEIDVTDNDLVLGIIPHIHHMYELHDTEVNLNLLIIGR